jgi:hypothetical protein
LGFGQANTLLRTGRLGIGVVQTSSGNWLVQRRHGERFARQGRITHENANAAQRLGSGRDVTQDRRTGAAREKLGLVRAELDNVFDRSILCRLVSPLKAECQEGQEC